MALSALAVHKGEASVGGFVAVNVWVINLFAPLNFLGTVYNALITATVDLRNLSELLARSNRPGGSLALTCCVCIILRRLRRLLRRGPPVPSSGAARGATPRLVGPSLPGSVHFLARFQTNFYAATRPKPVVLPGRKQLASGKTLASTAGGVF